MPGNSQRKGAVRRKGKGNTAGSGGRVRRAWRARAQLRRLRTAPTMPPTEQRKPRHSADPLLP